jgi:integrase
MLAAGCDLKLIQSRLGHADFATTANVYSHLLQNAQIDATNRVDSLLDRHLQKAEPGQASALEEQGVDD